LKLFQELGEEIKENMEGVNSSIMYLVHCKNLRKWHNVLPHITKIKGKNENWDRGRN
jgi:hypothetical protein